MMGIKYFDLFTYNIYMIPGKQTCKILKEIRKQIAQVNDIYTGE